MLIIPYGMMTQVKWLLGYGSQGNHLLKARKVFVCIHLHLISLPQCVPIQLHCMAGDHILLAYLLYLRTREIVLRQQGSGRSIYGFYGVYIQQLDLIKLPIPEQKIELERA